MLTRQPEGLTLTALSDALKMPKNTVFRIASTLTLRGYFERDEQTKVYRVSRRLLSLGHTAIGGERLVAAAVPVLRALRDATGETALLGVLAGSHGVVLDQVASSHPVKVVVEIGHAFTLHTAAPAKAMLAYWNDEARKAFVKQLKFRKLTRQTITSARAYLKALQEVKSRGYGLDECEESETFACAAAPVFDAKGDVVASVWISGPADRIRAGNLHETGRLVRRHADELSRKLGHAP
jgi:IclR family acetate operon transcriptional repressor